MTENLIASSVHRVIFGLGVTGLSCARYLYQRGESFSVVDTRDVPPGLLELRREMPDVPVFTATIPVRLLESAVEIIVSPGVALSEPVLTAATEAGVPLVGDIDLFVREASAPVIGITGSNGKSTVTEWVGQMARWIKQIKSRHAQVAPHSNVQASHSRHLTDPLGNRRLAI